MNVVQKPCHNKLPLEMGGVYFALIGLETWQARSLGEASWLFHMAAGQSSEVERRHHGQCRSRARETHMCPL